jgi:hypothetical protein
MNMRLNIFLLLVIAISCSGKKTGPVPADFNKISEQYVRLGLQIGQYDPDFVDAYYGPDSLRPAPLKDSLFPKDSLISQVKKLLKEIQPFENHENDTISNRAHWLKPQLIAYERRIRIFSGETSDFDTESKELFGVVAPTYNEQHFKDVVKTLDSLLPGKGSIPDRYQALTKRFIIPRDKVDTVFKTAISESRSRTMLHYPLPAGEHFMLEFVTNKPWSGYNWYKGNFTSLIQINTDLDIKVERAVDVASHESYPGHHVYNLLLEKSLYREKGYVEVSLYPLFSPQSLIAEGSANFGIEVAFPGTSKNDFVKNVLLPLAGLDTSGLDLYFRVLELKKDLSFIQNEIARGLINKKMDEKEALRWFMEYALDTRESAQKRISFIKKYRSYVINYNYGQRLVKVYVESKGGTTAAPEKRWKIFGELLSNQVTTQKLLGVELNK